MIIRAAILHLNQSHYKFSSSIFKHSISSYNFVLQLLGKFNFWNRRRWSVIHELHWRQRFDLATVFSTLSLPQTGSWSVSQLSELLWRSNVRLAMFNVGQSTDGCHACLEESVFLLGWQLDDNAIIELSKDCSKCTSRPNEVITLAWEGFNGIDDCSNRKSSKRISVAFLSSNGNSRDVF